MFFIELSCVNAFKKSLQLNKPPLCCLMHNAGKTLFIKNSSKTLLSFLY